MIDTHAHIKKGEEIKIDGLDWVVLSASNIEDSRDNLELAKLNQRLRPAIGIHPQEKGEVSELEKLMCKEVVAIGECGLDYSDECDKNYQEKLFRGQIELALKYNKPIIIHSRKAMDETLKILNDYKNLRGVIHCYTGGIKRIKNIDNFYFGIDGNLTYEDGLVEVVKNIPKDRLLLETDSPYLTPIPFRGEQNYPQNVKYVYQKVTEIWGLELEETEKIIDENAAKLFNKI
jgi:TatD DNase family protein